MTVVAGVDGVRGGWVVAVVRADGTVRWRTADDAEAVLAVAEDCDVIAVDIPIGLSGTGSRACDLAARKRLGRAGSSVFPAPVRAVLGAATHAEACEVSARATGGTKISIQTWNIVPKIREWDTVRDDRVIEVHPEVSFRALAPDVGFDGKKTAVGKAQRTAALTGFVDAEAFATAPKWAGKDDALDALAAAWSARRWAEGSADVLGGEPDPATALPMRIVV